MPSALARNWAAFWSAGTIFWNFLAYFLSRVACCGAAPSCDGAGISDTTLASRSGLDGRRASPVPGFVGDVALVFSGAEPPVEAFAVDVAAEVDVAPADFPAAVARTAWSPAHQRAAPTSRSPIRYLCLLIVLSSIDSRPEP